MFRFFHRLKVSQKLGLISVLFLIPDTVLLCLFLISINSFIRFAEWEKRGNRYQRPLEILLEEIPRHHRALDRTDVDRTEAERAAARISEAFRQLESVDQEIGESLQFTTEGLAKRNRGHCRVEVLRTEWEALRTNAPAGRTDLDQAHRHLVADLRTMITHLGDNSNLILDPDLDSYYLMDVTLLALPQMQERLWTMDTYLSRIPRTGPTADERRQIAVHAALLREADLDRILGSARTALTEDPNFYGSSPTLEPRLRPLIDRLEAEGNAYLEALRGVEGTEGATAASETVQRTGDRLRSTSFEMWAVAEEEMDRLLDRRIGHFKTRRARSLILTGLALTAAVSFVWFITHSISGPLTRQANQLRESNEALLAVVAERRRVEEALRKAEEQYRSIFENAGEGIFQSTPDGRYLAANPALARMYGYDSVQEMQDSIADIRSSLYVQPGRREEFCREIGKTGRIQGFESEIRRRDGSTIWIVERARVVRDADGGVLWYEGAVEDITDRKAHEAEVERLHRELMEKSRIAGMAEIATGVLHNVGNVLNSMNVSATEVRDRLTRSRLGHLRSAVDLIEAHRGNLPAFLTEDPRGRALPSFLQKLATHLEDERGALLGEMDQLMRHAEHLKQVVSTQQSHARLHGVMEILRPQGLIEDALQLAGDSLERHGIQVEREYLATRQVNADRHKVLQILVNLLRNAKQAVTEFRTPERRIRVRLADISDGKVAIAVSDNGVGIPPENLDRLFRHGFTTKHDGHGFGLHASILAAREMDGDIRVHSDGPGLGATFTLELPAGTTA